MDVSLNKQCLMLDADVRKGVGSKPHADKNGQGGRKMVFFKTSFMDGP